MSIKQAIEALEFYANPEVYKPDSTGRVDDVTFVAIAALAALRSMPQGEPVATIRYERGTPGKENDMPKVVSCNWLPDGVYSVCATPHTEAVRMSEAEINELAAEVLGYSALHPEEMKLFTECVRAVEQATAARLGVKMGDAP